MSAIRLQNAMKQLLERQESGFFVWEGVAVFRMGHREGLGVSGKALFLDPGEDFKGVVLVFYCCHKKSLKKVNNLKQQYLLSQFCRSEVQVSLAGFSAMGLTRLKSRSWSAGSPKFVQASGRIQFLVAAGLRILFRCWLSARSLSQLR